jgi:hypothetical protein
LVDTEVVLHVPQPGEYNPGDVGATAR